MDRDIYVQMPTAMPVAGDNVLYSTRPFVDHTNGRPSIAGPVQPDERLMRRVSGTFQANQDAIVKFQFWDVVTKVWVTMDNNGAGTSAPHANGPANFFYDIPHAGDVQVVANFVVPPTAWQVPANLRLSQQASS